MNLTRQFSEPTLLILISLAGGSKHGYSIMEDIEESYNIKLGPGTLYGAINRIEKSELIEVLSSKDRRKPYKITPKGRKYLLDRLKEINKLVTLGFERLGE